MNDLLAQIVHHGYFVIFFIVLAEALGIPVPAALALLAGGAAVASGGLHAPAATLVAVTAMLLGDSLLYVLGSRMGWRLLGFLCRVSVDPETCILRSAESFYKRGRATLVIAKFIPGVNSMAPPLAGSMEMPFLQFWDWTSSAPLPMRLRMAEPDLSFATSWRPLRVVFERRDTQSRSWSLSPRLHSPRIASRCTGSIGRSASFREYRSQNWQQSCKVNMQKGFCWPMCAATVTMILVRTAFEDRFAWSRIICRRKSKHFPGTKTSTCTALDRAKRLAPVWRICYGNENLTRL